MHYLSLKRMRRFKGSHKNRVIISIKRSSFSYRYDSKIDVLSYEYIPYQGTF